MDYKKDNVTTKKIRKDFVSYAVNWSEMQKVDRYVITRTVPARPGIFELYYTEGEEHRKLFYMERVWYGGLRAEIRRASDPLEVADRMRRKVLSEKKCFYRYTIIESKEDMMDILHRFSQMLLPQCTPPAHSGRYENIIIEEDRA